MLEQTLGSQALSDDCQDFEAAGNHLLNEDAIVADPF
jgi:hypothetical protein